MEWLTVDNFLHVGACRSTVLELKERHWPTATAVHVDELVLVLYECELVWLDLALGTYGCGRWASNRKDPEAHYVPTADYIFTHGDYGFAYPGRNGDGRSASRDGDGFGALMHAHDHIYRDGYSDFYSDTGDDDNRDDYGVIRTTSAHLAPGDGP